MVFGSDCFNKASGGGTRPKAVSDGSGKEGQIREVRVDVDAEVQNQSHFNALAGGQTYGLKSPETLE